MPEADPSGLPFAFDIAMGVRKSDKALKDELNGILHRRQVEIDAILDEFGIPYQPPSRGTAIRARR